ncbi:unnamed protein product [Tilletia controversa]|uniref:Acid phosphatase n=2 Tax=Tilletia TaxID=13289 RepID=A0A177UUV7_9BASI|nr:hypothetical protein CF336_g2740 [Tilletia laevis]KAE8262859.1 hypothetical protein A4X03_0g2121 [Tilletia caries]CAD6899369.1 unnamed protein product [Tilletia controversa]KAE8206412.1 hypothetical protein CF335_g1912 [Tilletia laevis]CAD6903684.1 unnamed protein product [Tilletia caries]
MSGVAGSSRASSSSSPSGPAAGSGSGMEGRPHTVPLFADGSSTFPSPLPVYGGGSTAASPDLGWTAPPPDSRLELSQVHFFLRHGERTPVRIRLEKSTPPIPSRWNLCHGTAYMRANVLQLSRGQPVLDEMPAQRVVEAGPSKLVPQSAFNGECLPGELTNLGRMSSYEIGQKLRALYSDRLHFLPESVTAQDQELFVFRSTNMSRTVETCQQVVSGMLPSQARSANPAGGVFIPRIHVRNFLTETLIPNTLGCSRFRQLDRHYAEKAATTHNSTLEPLDATLSPHNDGQPIRVDGHPRLSGLLDTIRAAQAHGFPVPDAFMAPKTVELANKALLAEWFSGYNDPDPQRALEYRRLSMSRLFSELQTRLDSKAKQPEKDALRLGIYSTHDTTLAGILCTLDAFDNQWPAFAATLNFELFRRTQRSDTANSASPSTASGLLSRLGFKDNTVKDEHYVRVRYGAKTLRLPACAAAGKHLDGHAEFCTLDAFRQVVDSLQHPEGLSWEAECEAGAKTQRSSK